MVSPNKMKRGRLIIQVPCLNDSSEMSKQKDGGHRDAKHSRGGAAVSSRDHSSPVKVASLTSPQRTIGQIPRFEDMTKSQNTETSFDQERRPASSRAWLI